MKSEKCAKKLSEEHLLMVDAFPCVETPEMLDCWYVKMRRRIIKYFK